MSPSGKAAGELRAFDRYADWYDAFNKGKDYAAEAEYVLQKVRGSGGLPKHWLDVGCGTGHHLAYLHSRGIEVEGVDLSPSMVTRARLAHPHIPFRLASAQTMSLDTPVDVASMLFHVMSYQVSDAAIRSALERVRAYLAPLGTFAFDFWHSAGVLGDPPGPRVRQAQLGGRSLFRLSYPRQNRDQGRIDVKYEFRWDSPEGPLEHEELHRLRHFGDAQLATFLSAAGMVIVSSEGWMRDRPLSSSDWYGFICARPE